MTAEERKREKIENCEFFIIIKGNATGNQKYYSLPMKKGKDGLSSLADLVKKRKIREKVTIYENGTGEIRGYIQDGFINLGVMKNEKKVKIKLWIGLDATSTVLHKHFHEKEYKNPILFETVQESETKKAMDYLIYEKSRQYFQQFEESTGYKLRFNKMVIYVGERAICELVPMGELVFYHKDDKENYEKSK